MKFLRTWYIKQFSAMLFIALIVFVYAVKAFHTHDISSSNTASKPGKIAHTVKAKFSCAICDFHLAKDTDIPISGFSIACPLAFISLCYNYVSPVTNSVVLVSGIRGPPAFA